MQHLQSTIHKGIAWQSKLSEAVTKSSTCHSVWEGMKSPVHGSNVKNILQFVYKYCDAGMHINKNMIMKMACHLS